MSPAARLIRNIVQKLKGTFYEGPTPPKRLVDTVVDFATSGVRSQDDWTEFAAIHACEAYRTGYVRGAEYAERSRDADNPELLAAEADALWGLPDDGPPQIVDADAEGS